jgi:NADP-dependent 3-hydroxy acid dehydrogenase YdfG
MSADAVGERPVAVVTGASAGIGAATARALGARGWAVVLVARRAERLAEVAADVEVAGGAALAAPLDAADGTELLALRDRVAAELGPVRALVNSAGAGTWRWVEDTPPAVFEGMLDAPLRAAWHATHAFLPGMIEVGRGVVVHVGSPASLAPWPGATGYTVSRWGLRGLHEALRQDLRGTGVRSCHLLLGEVTSEYFTANPDSRQHIPRVARIIRTIAPEEAAAAVLRCLDRPRDQVFHPRALGVLQAVNRVAPGIVADFAWRTGRRRPAP